MENEEKRGEVLPIGNNQEAIFRSMMKALENFNQIETKEGDTLRQINLLLNEFMSYEADKAQCLIGHTQICGKLFHRGKNQGTLSKNDRYLKM